MPYDLHTEADLTNLAKLAEYDTLIFPSFRNVPADKLAAIQDTLTTLVKNYHVGLITAGDFMTNDATGAALPGDSYARMKSLLDISRVDGAAGVNADIVAGTSGTPMMAGYTAGELIHQYTNIGTSFFTSTDGLGTTLASQVINGQTYNAVLATETGGHNVTVPGPATSLACRSTAPAMPRPGSPIASIAASTNSSTVRVERNECRSDNRASGSPRSSSGQSSSPSASVARPPKYCSAAWKLSGSVPWKPKIACL